MRVIIREHFGRPGYGLWIMQENGKNEVLVAKPIELEFGDPKPDAFMLPEPTLYIPYVGAQSFLQSMINALVEQGLSPSNDKTAGELEATKKHLQDLQKQISGLMDLLNSKVK